MNGKTPEILLIAPVATIDGIGDWSEEFYGAEAKSKQLVKHYQEICALEKCHFFSAGTVAKTSMIDGIHLEADEHLKLGERVAEIVKATVC